MSPQTARDGGGSSLRILMIGPVNSPHTEHLATLMASRGHTVHVGGAAWGDGLGPSTLPQAGIPVSLMTKPQPLWLAQLIRTFRPDVVHANWMLFAALAAAVRARPLVAMAWGSDVYLAGRLQRLANAFAVRRADCVLADSSALLERLIELGAPPNRTALINWGVDLEQFTAPRSDQERQALRRSLGLADGPVIISPRGMKSLYRPGAIIDAFHSVREQIPEAQLVLKHQGEQIPDLGRLQDTPGVHVVGRIAYEQMADYFRAADVCVSIPTTDSSPRSVWEAMGCGCACVLSDLPWVHELIEPDVHALVVSPDPESVAAAMQRLLTDDSLRGRIAVASRQLVERHRNAEAEMDRLEAFYFSLAGRPAPSAAAIASSNTPASSAVSARRE